MSKRRTYNVDSPIKYDGEQYHPDDKELNTIELSDKEAKPLLAVNAISMPDDKPEQKTSGSNVVPLKNPPPEDQQERINHIKAAIIGLEKDVDANWTKDELPDANALTERLGWKVRAEERNQAWSELNELKGEGK